MNNLAAFVIFTATASADWRDGSAFHKDLIEQVTGNSRRRLAGEWERPLDDTYYEECYFQINMHRAKEGLPALKYWHEGEECADRMARYDAQTNRGHGSIKDGRFANVCHYDKFKDIEQAACPDMHRSKKSVTDCVSMWWGEKNWAQPNSSGKSLECKSGGCDHYYTMRGGQGGYNKHDRVACGFYYDNGELNIVANFARPNSWSKSETYDFRCGGVEKTQPGSLLVKDCDASIVGSGEQYEQCGEDYAYHACPDIRDGQALRWTGGGLGPRPETDAPAPIKPPSVPTSKPTKNRDNKDKKKAEQDRKKKEARKAKRLARKNKNNHNGDDEKDKNSQDGGDGSGKNDQDGSDDDSNGALPVPKKCVDISSKKECKGTAKCAFFEGTCHDFDGICVGITNKVCVGANGCEWDGGSKKCGKISV